jgi:hypothetical protein
MHPDKVEKLIVMNAPHFLAYNQQVNLEQLLKSWYMLFFQVPVIPEAKLRR